MQNRVAPLVGAAAALVVLGSVAGAPAQPVDDRYPTAFPAAAGAAYGPNPGATQSGEWSGEAGASGHPLMTRQAILEAAANFPACIEGLWPAAARRGVSRPVFEQQTAGLTPDLKIMDFLDAQPEFTKAFWDYLETLVSDSRIEKGRDMLLVYGPTFEAAEKAFGVDRHVIAAIWGIESKYGSVVGERPVIRSTATLACVGRRQNYFRDEFVAALEIVSRGDLRSEQLKGSWAGAFGPTQFMPTSFRRFAVDFDADGRRDVVDSVADMIASTANNLKKDGWIAGQSWGYEVVLPNGFDYRRADRSHQLPIQQWEQFGIRRADGKAFGRIGDRAYVLVPAGARGPAFLMLTNFRVIMKYNPAEAYALAIGHLADRLRGGGPFVQPWPRDEGVLSREERLELQQRLSSRGFDVGDADGRLGAKTRAAVRDFQLKAGLTPDGFATGSVLNRLRGL
jgi:lytic murein transglycosylase